MFAGLKSGFLLKQEKTSSGQLQPQADNSKLYSTEASSSPCSQLPSVQQVPMHALSSGGVSLEDIKAGRGLEAQLEQAKGIDSDLVGKIKELQQQMSKLAKFNTEILPQAYQIAHKNVDTFMEGIADLPEAEKEAALIQKMCNLSIARSPLFHTSEQLCKPAFLSDGTEVPASNVVVLVRKELDIIADNYFTLQEYNVAITHPYNLDLSDPVGLEKARGLADHVYASLEVYFATHSGE